MFRRLCLLGIAILFLGIAARAQTTNGQINGTVTDSSGAVVPGASIDVLNQVTGQHRTSTSTEQGTYTVPQLNPGTYAITATKAQFGKQSKTGLNLEVSQNATVDFNLTVSGASETISVTDAPPLLDTTSGHLSEVIESDQIVDLPLNGRSFTQLALLVPGASPIDSGQQRAFTITTGSQAVSPAMNGQRGQQNNFTMDGVLNNSLYLNTWAISPPPDAQKEFAVTTHITDAQFSISSGANINIATKSGTQSYHGAVWEFLRNNDFDALQDSPGVDQSKQKMLPYHQNQYGYQFDGPIPGLKKNTWFSSYWEGLRIAQTTPAYTDVPTAAERTGNFSDILGTTPLSDGNGKLVLDSLGNKTYANEIFDPFTQTFDSKGNLIRTPINGINPATGLPSNDFSSKYPVNPATLAILNHYYPLPHAGRSSLPGQGGNLYYPFANTTKGDQFGIRLDHRFANNDLLFGRFSRSNITQTQPDGLPTYSHFFGNYSKQLAIGYTHLFGPNTILDLHYGYTQTNDFVNDQPAGDAIISATNWAQTEKVKNGVKLGPNVVVQGFAGVNQSSLPLGPQKNHDGHADVSAVRGNHTLGAGAMLYRVHSFDDGWGLNTYFFNTTTSLDGGWGPTGNGMATMVLGPVTRLDGFIGDTAADDTTLWQGYYVQDQWKATKKLTLSAGLRYDFVPPPTYSNVVSGVDPHTGIFNISKPEPAYGFPTRVGAKNYLNPQYDGFQPRVGFAYNAKPNTVVRGAFAMFDDHNNTLVQQAQDMRISYPRAQGVSINGQWESSTGNRYLFGQNLPTQDSFFVGLKPFIAFNIDPHAKVPYSIEYNFGLEQQITAHIALNADYVGSVSRHQFIQGNFNTATIPGPGSIAGRGQIYPQYGPGTWSQDMNIGNGSYNSLQAKLKASPYHGLSFLASYTWSKSMDEESEGQAGTLTDILHASRDWGPSDFNLKHMFVLSGIYQLPFGHGKQFLSSSNKVTELVLGNWNAASIFTARSGNNFNISCGDTGNLGWQTSRCNRTGVNPYANQHGLHYLNPAAFSQPALYTIGNERRNDLVGPGNWNEDFSVFKNFSITETTQFQFRSDFFNVLNHPNIGGPDTNNNNLTTGHFGIMCCASGPRNIQLAAKILF